MALGKHHSGGTAPRKPYAGRHRHGVGLVPMGDRDRVDVATDLDGADQRMTNPNTSRKDTP